MSEAERQKQHYDRKANAISLDPGDLVLAKADAYRERRKVKDQWEEELYKMECQVAEGIPSYLIKTNGQDAHKSSTKINFFSLLQQRGLIFVWLCRLSWPCVPPPP